MALLSIALFFFGTLLNSSFADIPVNCTVDDVLGEWIFYEEKPSTSSKIDCDKNLDHHRKMKIVLKEGGLAMQDDWVRGAWTMTYNEGMEVTIGFRTYFAYFKYKQEGDQVISYCNVTTNGKSHDVTLRNYACFYGKQVQPQALKISKYPFANHHLYQGEKMQRVHFEKMAEEINSKQTSWEAAVYNNFAEMTLKDLQNIAGGHRSWMPSRPRARLSLWSEDNSNLTALDWRSINGENFVSPVRNQGQCGSCYAFSSVGMMEARLRLYSRNKLQPTLSPQDIVSCTPLAQGCEGGFPFLIAGRYGWENGLAEESCYPYEGSDSQCSRASCDRWYTAAYTYVGGYFGACSEKAMIEALGNGPLSVSFEVNPDFMSYKSGIYRHTGTKGQGPLKNFVPVNHAVLLIGYGVDANSGEKYWIVKNSWGEEWGEQGFFRILRGVDEVGIESIAVQAFPIPKY